MTDPTSLAQSRTADSTVYDRARQAKAEADANYAELRAGWLDRSRREAARRWRNVLGDTDPESWEPVDPDPYERDHLRIRVDGLWFTQEGYYSSDTHHKYLLVEGSDERITNALTLAHALDDRSIAPVRVARRWWQRGR